MALFRWQAGRGSAILRSMTILRIIPFLFVLSCGSTPAESKKPRDLGPKKSALGSVLETRSEKGLSSSRPSQKLSSSSQIKASKDQKAPEARFVDQGPSSRETEKSEPSLERLKNFKVAKASSSKKLLEQPVGKTKKTRLPKALEQTLRPYSRPGYFKVKIEREVHQVLLEQKVKSQGVLELEQGLFRMEFEKPERLLVLNDGKHIWSVTSLPEEFGGGEQALKVPKEKIGKDQMLIAAAFDTKKLNRDFRVKKEKKKGSLKTYVLEARSEHPSFKKLMITIELKKKKLKEVSFIDSLDNEIKFKFLKQKKMKKSPKGRFRFRPSKKTEVINYE